MIEDLKHIAEELEQRIQEARGSIAEAAMENNWDKAQAITAAAKRLEDVTHKVASLKKDIRKAINEYDVATKSHTKAKHTKLLITIRWALAGESISDEVIDDESAADALAHFLESLVNVQGERILQPIKRVQVGSSGLVSQNPESEFRNPNNDNLYGYRPVGSTGWFVKTHSSTSQKEDQIHQIKTLLGMPRNAIDVEVVEK